MWNRRHKWLYLTGYRLFRTIGKKTETAEQKTILNSVPWKKSRRKLSEFRSNPFRRRENNSEFHTWNKNRRNFSVCCSKPFCWRENNSKQNTQSKISLLSYFCYFVKLIFSRNSVPFRPELRNWLFCRARTFKCLWGPGIDYKELIPPAYVAWRAGTKALFLLGA